MPKATINIDETVRYDLKTCPEGFVVLRRLPYGKWLRRQEMAMNMTISGEKGNAGGSFAVVQRKVVEFEFKECVSDHNLENENGQPLDFNKGMTLDMLDPKIGNEIGQYISDLHSFGDEASLGNSNGASEASSSLAESPTLK